MPEKTEPEMRLILAAVAMHGLLASGDDENPENLARRACDVATALLAEHQRRDADEGN